MDVMDHGVLRLGRLPFSFAPDTDSHYFFVLFRHFSNRKVEDDERRIMSMFQQACESCRSAEFARRVGRT